MMRILKMLSVVLVFCLMVAPCAASASEAVVMPEAVVREQSGVRISVEPVIELLAVIQHLSDYNSLGLITGFDLDYKKDIDAYFAGMEKHEAIDFVNKSALGGFAFDVPPTAALMMNPDFSLNEVAFAVSDHETRTKADINEFIKVMKSFYVESNFEKFYLDHAAYYGTILENVAECFPDWDVIGSMENFFGKKMDNFNLVLSSMFHPGGYGPSIEREDGPAVYSVQGPIGEKDGLPLFGDTESFSELVVHEFGHSFVPITGETKEIPEIAQAVKDSEHLMEPIQKKMAASAYPQWPTACEELVLRAAVIRLLEEHQKMDVAPLIQQEYDNGFIYIQTVYDLLEKYIDNRAEYPVFDSFVPTLLNELVESVK